MFYMSVILPVLAAVIHGIGYTLYNWQTLKGVTKPNTTSLFIWLFLAVLNAVTFTAMNDTVAALQTFVGVVGMTLVFLLALFTGKLQWPTVWEWPVLMLCLLSAYVLRHNDATLANMVIVGGVTLSFIPYIYGLYVDPRLDHDVAWWLFAIAWATTSVNTFIFHGGFTISMVMPVVMTVAHLVVALLCRDSRKTLWFKEKSVELAHVELQLLELNGGKSKIHHLTQGVSSQNDKLVLAAAVALYAFNRERERLERRKTELEKLGIV